jgi:tellurite resistance protein
MNGNMNPTNKTLSPQAIAGCLDVLCKAHAQIAPADANLAEEIREAIETIMEACNSIEKEEENVEMSKENKADQFKQTHTEIIEDLFTGEILYRGIK